MVEKNVKKVYNLMCSNGKYIKGVRIWKKI